MLSHALSLGAVMAALEVRASNEAAITLYRKYGFEVNRVRKGYYRDNLEDALEMIAQPLEVH
jgi:ribosomal-protein-alanine N-acetyltransferase